jgi:hypothetical protein
MRGSGLERWISRHPVIALMAIMGALFVLWVVYFTSALYVVCADNTCSGPAWVRTFWIELYPILLAPCEIIVCTFLIITLGPADNVRLRRGLLYVTIFLLVAFSYIDYNASPAPSFNACCASYASVSMTTSGFSSTVGPPIFQTEQLIMAPGMTAFIYLNYTFGQNLTRIMTLGPFYGLEDLDGGRPSPGVTASQTSLKVNGSRAMVTITIIASPSAPSGVYHLDIGYANVPALYLVVGHTPYVALEWPVLTVPALQLADTGLGALSSFAMFVILRLSDWRDGRVRI